MRGGPESGYRIVRIEKLWTRMFFLGNIFEEQHRKFDIFFCAVFANALFQAMISYIEGDGEGQVGST